MPRDLTIDNQVGTRTETRRVGYHADDDPYWPGCKDTWVILCDKKGARGPITETRTVTTTAWKVRTDPDLVTYEGDEYNLDDLARATYEARSQTPEPYSDDRWASIKAKFPGSVRQCREDILRQMRDGDF